MLTSLHFKGRHLQIGFNNVSDRLPFMSRAIALMDLLGLRRILALTALIIFGIREDRGLPLRGRSSVL